MSLVLMVSMLAMWNVYSSMLSQIIINRNSRQKSKEAAQQYVDEYKSTHPCTDCGNTDVSVLTFDHVRGAEISKYLIRFPKNRTKA